jgi:hypothetical protein
MKRIFILALLALAAWFAWKNWPTLFERAPSHEAVVENRSGRTMTRIRVEVGGQTLVREELPDGESTAWPFRIDRDSEFQMTWEWREMLGERRWRGGFITRGPLVQRHVMMVDGDGEVIYRPEAK